MQDITLFNPRLDAKLQTAHTHKHRHSSQVLRGLGFSCKMYRSQTFACDREDVRIDRETPENDFLQKV